MREVENIFNMLFLKYFLTCYLLVEIENHIIQAGLCSFDFPPTTIYKGVRFSYAPSWGLRNWQCANETSCMASTYQL